MFIPPQHPDEHLMHDRNRQQEAQRNARSGHFRNRRQGLTTGDKIIFLVLGIAVLAGAWFLFWWLLAP